MKFEHNRLISGVDRLENDFLTELKNINFDELKETTAGRELLELLQDSEIFQEYSPYPNSSIKTIASKSVQDYFNLGIQLAKQNRFEEAEAAYRQAIEKDPNFAVTYSNLGVLFTKQNRFEEAEAAYRQAIEKDPNDPVVYSNLGILLAKQNRFEEAEAAYLQAIEKDPNDPVIYINLGILFTKQNRPKEALAAHRKAIEKASNLAQSIQPDVNRNV